MLQEILAGARDAISVKRVFGEPYERDGVTIIPAARVQGGGGGGEGQGPDASKGTGTGFGLTARPVGAYVIRDGNVSWQPAIDVNRVILGGQIVAVVALLVCRSAVKARRKRGAA